MRFSTLFAAAGVVGSAVAGALPRGFSIPSGNGFPSPNPQQEQKISLQAGGKLPGGPLPTQLGPGSTIAFQLIAFNELFETAFFNSLLYNITNSVKGFEVPKDKRYEAENVIKTVLAQEEQHAIGALATLKSANKFAPSPCKYKFPTSNLKDAISLAETFTAVVLGVLQDANVIFSKEGLPEVVRLISAVIGQEGEQNGFYRLYLDQIPSESPFLTTVPAAFCLNIKLPIFPPLLVNGGAIAKIKAKDQTLSFEATLKVSKAAEKVIAYKAKTGGLYITYQTGLQLPKSVKAENVRWVGNTIKLQARFPFNELVAGGFTHAALTTANNFQSVDDIPAHTLAAPGLIQVQEPISGKGYYN
ncbi:hypothetical protein CEP52_003992 [Fusarium oligoseptatum]|uniref:Late sexual development protein n=1 Tax=Fusarium oligoseptatum TaxID=2604345 RepID=A0A428U5L0_9HYPO|nr:hypothetical protein CEP52_003992 [Fusarium oligoseptatum]